MLLVSNQKILKAVTQGNRVWFQNYVHAGGWEQEAPRWHGRQVRRQEVQRRRDDVMG